MHELFFIWLAWLVLLAGLGRLAWAALACSRLGDFPGRCAFWELAWLGLASLAAGCQAWALFLPLDGLAQRVFVCCALPGLGLLLLEALAGSRRRWRAGDWTLGVSSRAVGCALLTAGFALLLAMNLAVQERITTYDTLLYHFSIVRWANEFAAVPGLANLHDRLGFNSSYLLLAALADNGPFDGKSAWIMPGLMPLLCFGFFLHLAALDRDAPARARCYAAIMLVTLLLVLRRVEPGLAYDDAPLLAAGICAGMLLRLSPSRLAAAWPLDGGRVLLAAAVGALGVSVKLTVAPWALGGGVMVALAAALGRAGLRRMAALCALPLALAAGYVARNVIQTGWPLYPAPLLHLGLSWEHPARMVEFMAANIKVGPRMGGQWATLDPMRFWSWFPEWIKVHGNYVDLEMLHLGLAAAVAYLLFWQRRPAGWTFPCWPWRTPLGVWDMAHDWLLLALGLGNLVFWFLTAPDMRFASLLFWIFPALGLGMILGALPQGGGTRRALTLVILCLLARNANISLIPRQPPTPFERWSSHARPVEARQVAMPHGPMTLFTPREGDQCGDGSLLCTPTIEPGLRLRKPGDLSRGFELVP